MNDVDKLRVMLAHWIDHNGEHAREFRGWADRAKPARGELLAAADLLDEANARLQDALERLGGPLEHRHEGGQSNEADH